VFTRPRAQPLAQQNPLVGHWHQAGARQLFCLHAVQTSDGALFLWLDRQDRNIRFYGSGIAPWRGDFFEDGHVSFQLVQTAGLPHVFDGKLNEDRTRFEGLWSPGFGQPTVFIRSKDQRCSER
jgi:hypothetical protein